MTATDRYFLRVNKKHLIFDIFAVIIFSGLMGDTPTIGIIYYLCSTSCYMFKFLFCSYSSDNSKNLILILPFSRRMIFRTYVKMHGIVTFAFMFFALVAKGIYSFFSLGSYNSVFINPIDHFVYFLAVVISFLSISVFIIYYLFSHKSNVAFMYCFIVSLSFFVFVCLVSAICLGGHSVLPIVIFYCGVELFAVSGLVFFLVYMYKKCYKKYVMGDRG